MRYLIILMLFSIQVSGQILKPQKRVDSAITYHTKILQDRLFRGPHFQQPIVYIDYSPLFPGLLGLTRKIGEGVYMIDINPMVSRDQLEWVVMHELVHVWQMHTRKLYKTERHFIYNNLAYPFTFPYHIRPWELEAERITSESCHPEETLQPSR